MNNLCNQHINAFTTVTKLKSLPHANPSFLKLQLTVFLSRLSLRFLFHLDTNVATDKGGDTLLLQHDHVLYAIPPDVALSPPYTINDVSETDHQDQAAQYPPRETCAQEITLSGWSATHSSNGIWLLLMKITSGRSVHPTFWNNQSSNLHCDNHGVVCKQNGLPRPSQFCRT